ncbi:WbqC family protein [Spongiivirga sp. MCCC 1A20706]|uniref:WbqC family protein n=1 Tax=Spongiivirga sp. MCCC 1A20706 TaxID=3160963 RepID=UPI0039779ACB
MTPLLHPCYFGSIAQYAIMSQHPNVIFEAHDNYQKQTYRNRMYIYGANGKQLLNIPVQHQKGKKIQYTDVLISYVENWQKEHWKSLESAYRTSPFFEFYEDELAIIYKDKEERLMNFNLKCHQFLSDNLPLETQIKKSKDFKAYGDDNDFRYLVNAKQRTQGIFLPPYTQVFSSKHGFISNLSVLDLLFNEGPNAISYLERSKIEGK